MCHYIKNEKWTRGWSREHQVPYAFKDNQWVGYDDEESIKIKVDYIIKYCLGGAMVWSIDLDDFKNTCSDKPYPLTRLISVNLKDRDRKRCNALNKIKNDKDIDQYLREIVKWVPSSNEIEDTNEDKYQAFFTTTTTTTIKPTTTTTIAKFSSTTSPKTTKLSFTFPTTRSTVKVTPNYPIYFHTQSSTSTTSSPRYFYLTNMFNKLNTNKMIWTVTKKQPIFQTSSSKHPMYEIDHRPEKLNELMILAYQNSFYRNNESLLDQLFQQFLTNMTKSKVIDDNINAYRQANALNREKLFFNTYNYASTKQPSLMFKNTNLLPLSFGYEYLQATLPFQSSTTAKTTTKMQKSILLKNNYGCENLPDGEFVRDPEDCSSFFTCFMGIATKKSTCNDGLFFDSKLRVCNWKSNVECG